MAHPSSESAYWFLIKTEKKRLQWRAPKYFTALELNTGLITTSSELPGKVTFVNEITWDNIIYRKEVSTGLILWL